jgi:hypothetical protein
VIEIMINSAVSPAIKEPAIKGSNGIKMGKAKQ